jgi:hypothetical protein
MTYSYDGKKFYSSPSGTVFSGQTVCIRWNGTYWLAVGTGTNNIAWSGDGINWRADNGPTSSNLNGLCWGNNIWVAGDKLYGYLNYSYDGITWTQSTYSTGFLNGGIEYGGSLFVSTGGSFYGTINTMAYSIDGINWTGTGNALFPNYAYNVAYNGRVWVVAGDTTLYNGSEYIYYPADGAGSVTLAYSYDGKTWTAGTSTTSIFTGLGVDVKWNGQYFVAIGQRGGSSSATPFTIAYSIDGINWSGVYGSTDLITSPQSLTWNGTYWLVYGYGANLLVYATDPSGTWTASTDSDILASSSGNCIASRRVTSFPSKSGISFAANQSAFGAASGAIVTANSLQFRMNPVSGSVFPQVRGNSATPNINWSGTASINSLGATALAFSNGGTALSSSTWTNFFSTNMGSGGDSAIINIQDQTNSFAYRATYIRGTASDASGGSASIIIERIL